MTKLPYLPLFFGDFLASTYTWKGEQQSLYLLLLMHQWASGPLPKTANEIADAIRYDRKRFAQLWAKVSGKFIEVEDGLINPRLEEHRTRAGSITEKRRSAGKEGAASKWGDGKTSGKSRSERLANARQLATHSKSEWLAMMEVCGHRCVKCGTHSSELHGESLCKDHIKPVYVGGSDGIENIQPMCRNCNSSKGPRLMDYRPNDWRERMANACQTSSKTPAIQSNPREEAYQGGKGEV